ncbi:MAG: energy-coupled thiamine transporter ThiT, partial [Clostridia bacterium]|nr:energy-coupled thiamine transporter ThiT [Clostridia bacterium]
KKKDKSNMLELLKDLGASNGEIAEKLDVVLDFLSTIALYLTIALVVGIVIYAIAIRNKSEDQLSQCRRGIVGVVIGYALSTIGLLGTLKVVIKVLEETFDANFWVVMGMFAIVLVGVVVCLVLQKHKPKAVKWTAMGFAIAFGVYAILMAIFAPTVDEWYKPINDQNALFVILTVVLSGIIVVLALLGDKDVSFDTKALSYGAVCVALSFALSYVKFFSMPQGGSVTFASLLPLALYSFMFGTRRGVIVGVVYGLLQFVKSPQFYQPVQVLIDYPIAFGAIGVAGIARNFKFLKGNTIAEFCVGATIAILLRYLAHTLSGYFVFYSWAPIDEGYTALSWTLVYNLYVLVDLAIVLAMGAFALASKNLRTLVKTVNAN